MTALGAVLALSLSTMGAATASATSAAYATASREGIKSFVPVIISGVLGIYGLIVAVILSNLLQGESELNSADGYRNFAAGLAVGLPCLASGSGISSFMLSLQYPGTTSIGEPKQAVFHNQQGEPLLMDTPHRPKIESSSMTMTVKAMMMLCFLEAL
eukprot:scaffold46804_cov199-Amphora_coffeaeformis.AAC.1